MDTKWIRSPSILEQYIPELVSDEAAMRLMASIIGICA